jgi:hypothetical protein
MALQAEEVPARPMLLRSLSDKFKGLINNVSTSSKPALSSKPASSRMLLCRRNSFTKKQCACPESRTRSLRVLVRDHDAELEAAK